MEYVTFAVEFIWEHLHPQVQGRGDETGLAVRSSIANITGGLKHAAAAVDCSQEPAYTLYPPAPVDVVGFTKWLMDDRVVGCLLG